AYGLLEFANDTGWAAFLKKYLEDTQREPRYVDGEAVPRNSHLNARPGLFGTFAEVTQVKGGGPDDSKGGGPDDSKGGGPDDSKGGGPDDSKGGGPDDSKGVFADETKGGGPDDSKSGVQLSGLKIGEMKNPPIVWFSFNLQRDKDYRKE